MYFNLYPAKEVELFPGLGIYSGIFVLYLQCRSPESTGRTANLVFYALCVLHILSAAYVVVDILTYTVGVSNIFISKNIIFLSVMQVDVNLNDTTLPVQLQLDLQSIGIVQGVLFGCCDVIGQCILVSTNPCTSSIHLTLQRSTVVGLCVVRISAS